MRTPEQFVEYLSEENEKYFSRQPSWAKSYWPVKMDKESAIQALRMRYWNEYIGAEVIARFMLKLKEPLFKMMVGRQVGDESKHAFFMNKRIKELGGDVGEPLKEQLEFYQTLDGFEYPEEFFSAQQFTVETQSIKRNEQALHSFDAETAETFRNHINNDELFHVSIGRTALLYYCVDEVTQKRAYDAAIKIADKHIAMSLANYEILKSMDKILKEKACEDN